MKKNFTVIIPAAGKGTRFYPFTHVTPKELLPIMQYPAIEFINEEYNNADATDAVYIIHETKKIIIDYVNKYTKNQNTKIHVAYQTETKGLGHAVLQAESYTQKNEYCGILLPDDIIFSNVPVIEQLKIISKQHNASVVAIKKVDPYLISSYGVISYHKQLSDTLFLLDNVVEKPLQEEAPSSYAIIGRYILHTDIFNALKKIKPGAKGEYQLTDAINMLIHSNHKVIGCLFEGEHFDIGTPEGWLKTVNFYSKKTK